MQPDIYAQRMRAYQLFFAGGGLVLPPAIDLVTTGATSGLLTFARTQPSANATAIGTDDVSLDFYAANVPRYQGSARRLLLEGARTNLFLNSATGATQNITVTAVAHTLTFYGTGTITLSGASVAGPLVGTGANNRVALTFTPSAGTLTLTVTGTCTRVQLEVGAFASSYAETTASSFARGGDGVSVALSVLNIPPNGACTVLGSTMIPQSAPGGINQAIMQIDAASDNNRLSLRNSSGGNVISIINVSGGVASSAVNAGTMTPGTLFRWGFTCDGTGRSACSFNGAAAVTQTGGPTSGLTTLRIGAQVGGFQPFAEFGLVRVLSYSVTDAQLPGLVSALP